MWIDFHFSNCTIKITIRSTTTRPVIDYVTVSEDRQINRQMDRMEGGLWEEIDILFIKAKLRPSRRILEREMTTTTRTPPLAVVNKALRAINNWNTDKVCHLFALRRSFLP